MVENSINEIFVGRREQIEILFKKFDQAKADQCQVAFLPGDPGIGKTTLVQMFKMELFSKDKDCRFIEVRCAQSEQVSTKPFQDLLIAPMQSAADQDISDFQKKSITILKAAVNGVVRYAKENKKDILADSFSQFGPFKHIFGAGEAAFLAIQSQVSRRNEMVNRTAKALIKRAAQNPLIIFMDDWQHARDDSNEFLIELVKQVTTARILFIIAYRPAETKTDFDITKRQIELLGFQDFTRNLSGLGKEEIKAYLEQQFPAITFGEDFLHELELFTQGNPLILVEILGHWQPDGKDIPLWNNKIDDLAQIHSYADFLQNIAKQFEKMQSDEKELLSHASIEGRRFSDVFLHELLGHSVTLVANQVISIRDHRPYLLSAPREGAIYAEEALTFEFKHQALQETAFSHLSKKTDGSEILFKRTIRNALEIMQGFYHAGSDQVKQDLISRIMELAELVNDHLTLARMALEVSKMNADAYKPDVLRASTDKGLEALDKVKVQSTEISFLRLELLLLRGRAYDLEANWQEALQIYKDIQEAARANQSMLLLAKALNREGYLTYWYIHQGEKHGGKRRTKACFTEAIQILTDLNDPSGMDDLATAYMGFGLFAKSKEDVQKAAEYLEKAKNIFFESGNHSGLASALHNQAINMADNRSDEKLERYSLALEARGYLPPQRHNIGVLFRDENDLAENQGLYTRYLAGERPLEFETANTFFALGSEYRRLAKAAKAPARQAELTQQAIHFLELSVLAHGDDRSHAAHPQSLLAQIYRDEKCWDQAITHLEKAISITKDVQGREVELANYYQDMGNFFLDRGAEHPSAADDKAAIQWFKTSNQILQKEASLLDPRTYAVNLNQIGVIRYRQGSYTEAAACFQQALDLHQQAVKKDGKEIALVTGNLNAAQQKMK
jgi:tetratricopeptide (TPR) repeat protein